jgi:hypothetical protein
MKNVLWSILICLLSFSAGKYIYQPQINFVNDCPVMVFKPDTIVIPKDTMYVAASDLFKSRQDLELFIKYVKTQSGNLDDDNWAVMKVMKNRMLQEGVTFSEYFYNRRINNSQTISRVLSGQRVPGFTFSWDNPMDVELVQRALDVFFGSIPAHIDEAITHDVQAFESHPISWNLNNPRGIFDRKNIAWTGRHEFYRLKNI